jgi:hypothetical protein
MSYDRRDPAFAHPMTDEKIEPYGDEWMAAIRRRSDDARTVIDALRAELSAERSARLKAEKLLREVADDPHASITISLAERITAALSTDGEQT